ncbi:sodium/hydrogen exchanger 2-like protein, partial [Dinothrombium tinctorium]
IILESAYSLHDRTFFANIATILLYAIIGTFINVILIAISLNICAQAGFFGPNIPMMECAIFATLISAVDPVAVLTIFQEVNVNKSLYFLVFGESLLNDAVVVTLYSTISKLILIEYISANEIIIGFLGLLVISFGGVILGALIGVFTALATLYTEDVRVVEPLIVIMMAYLSYVIAELFHFSGIISLTTCGLVQAEYARNNLSKKSRTTIKYMTKTLSSIADVIIFLFLGIVLVRENHIWNTNFVIYTTVFCVVYRFLSVFALTYCANNYFQRVRVIDFEEQLIMAYGGLRGAIAFCLSAALNSDDTPNAQMFTTTTLLIVLFTVYVLGSTVKPAVRVLRIQIQAKQDTRKLFLALNDRVIETIMSAIEEISGQRSMNYWMVRIRF